MKPGSILFGLTALSAAGAAAGATYIARRLVTPTGERPERIRILSAADGTVTLKADGDTLSPGTYSLYWGNRSGHARIGSILALDETAGTVIRTVERVYSGELRPDTTGYWSGYVYPNPAEAGLAAEDVTLPGPAPAWLIRGRNPDAWVIHVHGLGGRRATGLRTAPLFHRLGYTQLLISYRGDGDAPATMDSRHHLGCTELDDLLSAIDYAAGAGARSIILSGWSMGAAMSLAAAHISSHRGVITGLILTAPVLDWRTTLAFNTTSARLPPFLATAALWLLRSPLHRLAGTAKRLDLRPLTYTGTEPPVPVLLLHSAKDRSTPVRASEKFAARYPERAILVRFPAGPHTQEWNADPARWETSVQGWLRALDDPACGHTA